MTEDEEEIEEREGNEDEEARMTLADLGSRKCQGMEARSNREEDELPAVVLLAGVPLLDEMLEVEADLVGEVEGACSRRAILSIALTSQPRHKYPWTPETVLRLRLTRA